MLPKTIAVLAAIVSLFVYARDAAAAMPDDACTLPTDLQYEISSRFPGRTVVRLPDLGDDDREFFKEGHGASCPGLVKVDFYGDGESTFALALTTKSVTKGKTELVVAHQVGQTWKVITLETIDGDAPVVWSEKGGGIHGRLR